MFVSIYTAGGHRYTRVVESVRQGGKVAHRHLQSLGPYQESSFARYRRIVEEWKPLERARVALADLEGQAGRAQGRGYFRKFRRRWAAEVRRPPAVGVIHRPVAGGSPETRRRAGCG